ncbi:ATP-dependent Clp protease adaptor ClpS [Labilibacter marinus]|uniref:ATP-dependent Clp protease adaptor ClpS n=1 Tax=Labilibacter marinus TaxID=1477105 RepID=UPI00094F6447|nr:ATP-dependent Clp protease adaptor ClpS [Labilibacter marinus]
MEAFGKQWESEHLHKGNGNQKMLVLFNDDINSFDYVIDTLCSICEHDDIQAEQCAFLTHFRGQCQIKVGDLDELVSIRERLLNKNLTVSLY